MDEFAALSTTDESFLSHNSSQSDSTYARFNELEKKIAAQADEIVCLKSTLADVLRRLTQLEGRAIVTTTQYHHQQSPLSRNGHHPRGLMKTMSPKVYMTNGYGKTVPRRSSQYSSSSSLQADTYDSGLSPSPSPQPSHHHRSIPPSRTLSMIRMTSVDSNLKTMKRWSASQDIIQAQNHNSRSGFGSCINLHANNLVRIHETSHLKDFLYNPVDGVIRFQLAGRAMQLHVPTELLSTYTIKNTLGPPPQRLKLEWVYGYRGKDSRHNLYLLPTGEIVYFMAAVVVLYNIDDQIQRHYTGHTSEIRSLAIHPNKLLLATGQACNAHARFEKRAHVRIWDSVSLNTLHIIGLNNEFDRGIAALAFSKLDGGNLLAIVDDSPDHVVSLWEWQRSSNGHRIADAKSSCDPVLAIEFHPMHKFTLISIGRGHIHFWDIEGNMLAKKVGSFEKYDKPKYLLCMCFSDMGEVLVGDSNGSIVVWHPTTQRIVRIISNAHEGPVFDICTLNNSTIVTGGGKDKKIIEWDSNFIPTGCEAKLPEQYGGIRTLTTGKGSMLIVGTTKNCILQGTMSLNFSLVIQGHIQELFALAVHPTQNQFVTAGYDKNLHLWDSMSHLVVWSKDIGESGHAAAFSPEGNVLVVSTTSPGRWIVFDATTRQLMSIHNDGSDLIECIKFSNDGRYLALSSRDTNVCIYAVSEEYKKFNRIGRCFGFTSHVTCIDWDASNTYIQTVTGSNEYNFWNASICRQLNNMSIARDLVFHTHNTPLGFHVFGIWPESTEGPLVTSLDRSNSHKLLVTGDDFGRLNLFGYPANQPKCLHHSYPGHSASLACVRFLSDDSRIISIGGHDSSIMQWAVI